MSLRKALFKCFRAKSEAELNAAWEEVKKLASSMEVEDVKQIYLQTRGEFIG